MQQIFTTELQKAANHLKNNELVIMPTETVYGLAANAGSESAIQKIFAAKGRPLNNPLIVHFANIADIAKYCEIPSSLAPLSDAFWPGPLTMVLPLLPNAAIAKSVLAGGNTLAVRIPAHPLARALIELAQMPIAAPSANLSEKISPTCIADLSPELIAKVAAVIDGGQCQHGLESTVIYLAASKPIILRHGAIANSDIAAALNMPTIEDQFHLNKILPSPGLLSKHYAPQTALCLNATHLEEGDALLAFGPHAFEADHIENLSLSGDLIEAAHNLYHMLHMLDRVGAIRIAVMPIPNVGLGLAINDRLKRAAS